MANLGPLIMKSLEQFVRTLTIFTVVGLWFPIKHKPMHNVNVRETDEDSEVYVMEDFASTTLS